jgi:hypothetical protein
VKSYELYGEEDVQLGVVQLVKVRSSRQPADDTEILASSDKSHFGSTWTEGNNECKSQKQLLELMIIRKIVAES